MIGRVNLKRQPRKLYAKDGLAALIGRFDGRDTSRAGLDFPWTGPVSSPFHPPLLSPSFVLFARSSRVSFFPNKSPSNFLVSNHLSRRRITISIDLSKTRIFFLKDKREEDIRNRNERKNRWTDKVFISEKIGSEKGEEKRWNLEGERERGRDEYKYKSVMEYREKWRGEKRLAAT